MSSPKTAISFHLRQGYILLIVPYLQVSGMALFPFILVQKGNPSKILVNHERIHLRQQVELGIVFFYLWYLINYGVNRLKGMTHNQAYHQIIFEREAYREDENLGYLTKRKWLAFLQY
ncbi:hypothetical protein [Flectobacillus longus]|uniref:hypothetical protein n=1 Tax=Flectobacillus longus TaxID=2984207 RepID=UPI0024B76A82|nr:hypothetical protein [Flectobacillus longus]MDI9880493.1 hypothetical protein [Flectobacillus longus]